MSATYSATLTRDLDWVRFLTGDRDVAAAKLEDEEINALLTEEANKYLAAARACELILARTNGIVTKQVGDLRIQYSGSSKAAYLTHVQSLRERGAFLTIPKPRAFRVL